MVRRIFLMILAVLAFTAPTFANDALTEKAYSAVALLYRQTPTGDLKMTCTTTAFEKTAKGYLFVSAAHCVGEDRSGRTANPNDATWFITFDDPDNKTFYQARPVAVGYQTRGDDFFIAEVQTKDMLSIIQLGDESLESVGNKVLNVASPLGLGKQAFEGTISMVRLERPLIFSSDSLNWKGSMLLEIGVGPGSSGSAIISRSSGRIVAFLVGSIPNASATVAIPVSKFKTFRKSVNDKKYKWYAPEQE